MWLSRVLGGVGLERDDRRVGRGLGAVDVLDVVDQAAFVLEHLLQAAARALDGAGVALVDLVADGVVGHRVGDLAGVGPLVVDHDLEALVEEGHLAEAVADRLQGVRRGLEDVRGGVPGHRRAGALPLLEVAHLAQRVVGVAEGELLLPQLAAVAHLDLEVAGQRVHHRDADAVQTAGHLVAAAAELAARVQHGQREGHGRQLLAGRGVGGDAAAVVLDPHPAVGLEGDHDPVAVAGQRLVDRVVHDLPDQVVQAALAGRADVHARPLAHRLQTLEDLDHGGVVAAVRSVRSGPVGRGRGLLFGGHGTSSVLDPGHTEGPTFTLVGRAPGLTSMIPLRVAQNTLAPPRVGGLWMKNWS